MPVYLGIVCACVNTLVNAGVFTCTHHGWELRGPFMGTRCSKAMFDRHSFLIYPWYAVEDVLSVFGFGIHYDLFPPYDVRCQSSLVMVEATSVLERLNIYKIVSPTFVVIAIEYQA